MNNSRSISFIIQGKPVARVNPKPGRWGMYDSQKEHKNNVRFELQASHPNFKFLQGALSFEFIFHIAMPCSWSKKKKLTKLHKLHTSKPDNTNMLKLIEDCCTRIFFKDDCQIAVIHGKKIWSDKAETHVTIREVTD